MGFQGMNKRGADLKSAFFSVISFSLIVISIMLLTNGLNSHYRTNDDINISQYERLDDISSTATQQQGRISPDDPDPGQDAESSTFRAVFGILTNVFAPFNTVFGSDGILEVVRERFGLPAYVVQGIVAMMIISLIFTLIFIIFRLGKS